MKHENSLVDDVFGKDNQGKVQMEKVVMLIWQFRDDPSVIQFMAQFVTKVRKSCLEVYNVSSVLCFTLVTSHSFIHSFKKFAGSRDVFAGIEFYLPQLAHMIIHLDVAWDDAILERFALVIAQQSLHFALQLNWILQAAIEDYEPELTSGVPNPGYNALYYSRCLLLLQNIERVVVYGRPRSLELKRLYDNGKITKEEYDIMELHDRRFNALQIQQRAVADRVIFGGELLYKRKVRTSCYKSKPWKTRYFCIQNSMLNCYNVKGGKLVRSMPLENAEVGDEVDGKYPNMFFVSNRGFYFVIRANSTEDKEKWMAELKEGAKAHGLFDETEEFLRDLSAGQRARFEFFRNERNFARDVCDIAERLRHIDRDTRKTVAPDFLKEMTIPPVVYVPLCNSTDLWRRVHKAIPDAVKVFNTNERCPVIMHFVSMRGDQLQGDHTSSIKSPNLDVAELLHLQFDLFVEESGNMDVIEEEESAAFDEDLQSSAQASVWHEEDDFSLEKPSSSRNPDMKGNTQLQAFLRESLTALPNKIANRIVSRRRISHLAKSTKRLETVPIIGEAKTKNDDDDDSVVSIEGGSIMVSKSVIMGKKDSDIDLESIQRATSIISGGVRWAEKTKQLLEENVTEDECGVAEITSLMAKSNDDLRQEVFVMQMIHFYKSVFAKANLPIWLKTYRILSISKSTGLIEVLTDATSIDGLKKSENFPKEGGLRAYFEETYGDPNGKSFLRAQRNFMESLCGYSLVMYLLGLKDRHNGNIMIDNLGHLIFIDFGFAMGMAPGHEFSMERAPFKLTQDYVDVLGGLKSECFEEFRSMFVKGFMEARKNSLIALGLVEIMMYKSNYPCFTGSRYGNGVALKRFEKRLMLHVPDGQAERIAHGLIDKSIDNFGTWFYDWFQHVDNGYAM
jgi:phosphatidylinositol 4-kinase A